MKAGVVALVGRPNVGKSTLLNNLLGQKVTITSPKPQTTRFAIQAVYEDERGQIIFVDTPGMFGRSPDLLSRTINKRVTKSLSDNVDLLVYLIDYSRPRDVEENKTLGIVRKLAIPKLLVINKIDLKNTDYSADYAFYEDEFDEIVKISALERKNLHLLIDKIFERLPEGVKMVDTNTLVQPGLNIDSKLFVSELIREKVYLFTRDELPYTVNTSVEQIEERPNGQLYVKGKIITTADRYKSMLIGKGGKMIREIGMAVRKELETATNKPVFIDLIVEVDPHWQDTLS